MRPLDDTIAAVASPPGGAARGIIRLSGPAAHDCVRHVVIDRQGPVPSSVRHPVVVRTALRLPGTASPLPADVYLWPRGRSYTGQAVAEIHTFGSPPLVEALLRALGDEGARPAEPGEFTLRAFLSGRIDLTQAEAVLGVIDAADARQLQTALAQLAGGLAAPLSSLRLSLIELLADLEAGLDFADEDIRFITSAELGARLAAADEEVRQLQTKMASRGATSHAVLAVLVGRPNVGKSSLFNALAQRLGAIVCEQAGTTRDYLVARIDLAGVSVELIDAPGHELLGDEFVGHVPNDQTALRQAAQTVASEQAGRAQVEVFCLDAGRPPDAWENDRLDRPPHGLRLVVWTKCDAAGPAAESWQGLRTSSITGEGIDRLRSTLREAAIAAQGPSGEAVAATAVRCHDSLRQAADALARARRLVAEGAGEELVAEETRLALDELGRMAGVVYTDDLLDSIFSRFCIGK